MACRGSCARKSWANPDLELRCQPFGNQGHSDQRQSYSGAGKQLPAQPKRQQQTGGKPFTGVVAERHATEGGGEYLRLTFGQPAGGSAEVDDPSKVIDAEFLFPPGITGLQNQFIMYQKFPYALEVTVHAELWGRPCAQSTL